MKKRFFVTGTDTDAGKTFVTVLMLEALKQKGLSTLALKPLAAGCEQVDGELRNDDALKLQAAMTVALPYQQINPIALKSAIAPHLAAEEEGRTLSVDRLAG
ncbi:MAG TPA: dethiobiotin synthase, partial [Gammaproteobacteria bacterium]|nr:dethiobiotin synthase [Gammaproteobacteria bacterium]